MLEADRTSRRVATALGAVAESGARSVEGTEVLDDLVGHRAALPVLRSAIEAVLPPPHEREGGGSVYLSPSEHIDRARVAVDYIGKFGPGANRCVEDLLLLTRADDVPIATAAIGALEGIGTPEAIEAIFSTFEIRHLDSDVRLCALETVSHLGWKAAPYMQPLQEWLAGVSPASAMGQFANAKYAELLRSSRRHYRAFVSSTRANMFFDIAGGAEVVNDSYPVFLPFDIGGRRLGSERLQLKERGRLIDVGVLALRSENRVPFVVVNLDRFSFGLEALSDLNAAVLVAAAKQVGCKPNEVKFFLRQSAAYSLMGPEYPPSPYEGFCELVTRRSGDTIEISRPEPNGPYESLYDCGIGLEDEIDPVPRSYALHVEAIMNGQAEAIRTAPEGSKVRFKEMGPIARLAYLEAERIATPPPAVDSKPLPASSYFPRGSFRIPTLATWLHDPFGATAGFVSILWRGAFTDESLRMVFEKDPLTGSLTSSEPPNHIWDARSVAWGRGSTAEQREAMARYVLTRLIEPMDDRMIPASIDLLTRSGVVSTPCARLVVLMAKEFAARFLTNGSNRVLTLTTRQIADWLTKNMHGHASAICSFHLGTNFKRLHVDE